MRVGHKSAFRDAGDVLLESKLRCGFARLVILLLGFCLKPSVRITHPMQTPRDGVAYAAKLSDTKSEEHSPSHA